MAPLYSELEGFYVAPGVAVWVSPSGGAKWAGVVCGFPTDVLGVWAVRKAEEDPKAAGEPVPFDLLRPRSLFGAAPAAKAPAAAAPKSAAPKSSAPKSGGGGSGGCPNNNPACQNPNCQNPNCGVGKKGGGNKKKGGDAKPAAAAAKGGKKAPAASMLAPSLVEPVDAFMKVLQTAAQEALGGAEGVDAAALAAAHAGAAADMRPWLKMSLRSFGNNAVAAGAQAGGNTLARGGLARKMV